MPNLRRVRCAVYKRLRENGAIWAKQLKEPIWGSWGGGGEKNSFCLKSDCWFPLYRTSLNSMGNEKKSYTLRKVNKNQRFVRV